MNELLKRIVEKLASVSITIARVEHLHESAQKQQELRLLVHQSQQQIVDIQNDIHAFLHPAKDKK
jgi:hypothetical protein